MIISIDIETTSLDPNVGQILEIAAVAWNSPSLGDCWRFHRTIRHDYLRGDTVAILMNKDLIERSQELPYLTQDRALDQFEDWLNEIHGIAEDKLTACGFNVGPFDMKWLREFGLDMDVFAHRHLEVGSLYADPYPAKSKDFLYLAEPYGIEGEPHQALFDAQIALAAVMEKFG